MRLIIDYKDSTIVLAHSLSLSIHYDVADVLMYTCYLDRMPRAKCNCKVHTGPKKTV